MRPIALGLLLAASFSLPGLAAEPDGPATLITPTEAVRITVQGLLSAKSGTGPSAAQKDALIEYYSVPDQRLLWVDDNGLNDRAKLVVAEIAKADDYGLRAADYSVPDAAAPASEPKPRDWLADAEVKVSYAVLDYAKDARGGRIEPSRVSKNLDPSLGAAQPIGSDRIDRHPVRPGGLFAQLPARPAPIRSAQAKAARRSGAARSRRSSLTWSSSPMGPRSNSALSMSRSRCSGSGSTCRPATMRPSSTRRCSRRSGSSSRPTAPAPTAWSAPARGGCSMAANGRTTWAARRGSTPSWSTWSAGAGCPTISAPTT